MPPRSPTTKERVDGLVASTGLAMAARDYLSRYLEYVIIGDDKTPEPSESGGWYTMAPAGAAAVRAFAHELLEAEKRSQEAERPDAPQPADDPYAALRD